MGKCAIATAVICVLELTFTYSIMFCYKSLMFEAPSGSEIVMNLWHLISVLTFVQTFECRPCCCLVSRCIEVAELVYCCAEEED